GALSLPAVPSFGRSRLYISSLELNRAREPCRRMHPGIDGDEEARLKVHAKHQRYPLSFPIEIDRVVAADLVSLLDLDPMLVSRPTLLTVLVRREGIAHQLESLASRRSDDELERSRSWIS